MRIPFLTFMLIITKCFLVPAQDLHTPAEIIKIMEASPVTYELSTLETSIPPKDRSDNLNYNDFYRISDGNEISTYKYKPDSGVKACMSAAEMYFEKNKHSLARDMYLHALELDSSYFMAMTYVGQTYGIQGDFEKASEWYLKTINLNYIDYMAHWFLADCYKKLGKNELAVNEITIAHILNRNNPRLLKSLQEIYKINKLEFHDWPFNPQYKIDSLDVNKVRIAFETEWLGYALVKALWQYEPGYSESMGVEAGSFSTLEYKECLLAVMSSFDKKKIKNHPEFKAMQLALDKKMITEFILYEIVLPDHPFVAYQLSEQSIKDIKDYVILARGNQK